jgi:transcriptional regulator with GAF, ATPase, and Fis domain
MKSQVFSLPAGRTTVTDLGDGVGAEQSAARVQHPDGLLQVLQVLCRQVVGSLRVVQGAGVTLRFRGSPFTVAHTASWVRVLQEREFEGRDGPGLRALHTQRVVTANQRDLLTRWPPLAQATQDAGVRAVHAVPLPVQQQPVGVLTLYSTDCDVVDPRPERLAPVRDLLTAALTGYCTAHPHEDHAFRLHRELHNRQLLDQAIGILITRHGISEDHARRMLDKHTHDRHLTPSTAARAVVRQHLSAGHSPPAHRRPPLTPQGR